MIRNAAKAIAAAKLPGAAGGIRAIDPAQIPGRYLGTAMHSLPNPWTTRAPQSAEVDIPNIGRVRIHFEWRRQAHKGFVPIWVTMRAERA